MRWRRVSVFVRLLWLTVVVGVVLSASVCGVYICKYPYDALVAVRQGQRQGGAGADALCSWRGLSIKLTFIHSADSDATNFLTFHSQQDKTRLHNLTHARGITSRSLTALPSSMLSASMP